ncbi:TPA: DUF3238 domain-containing protein [Bacillus wiedmannii]|uniref:Uncharacterized protein n=1 Tax=Bacillus mycoides TaxID=1405 RepID=A0A1D3MIW6_BACMY|nr:hypothetical protein IEM_05467 [Bacillus cereus BAG6O-2]MBJ8095805.1 DUF3238 domain-containing protein [Bacillus cereus]OFD99098.1 hypothetical protein BWGOE11_11050 [Bacillus mycoides]HDR3493736.1 DUF3238 domain-containing protein [Bacillus wiedmannii]MBJ8190531.1 DUF3238 domain-containing protein [Bacillus cereus]
MWLLVISVNYDTPKRRSLFEDFAFVYTGHERFRFLLSYVKHNVDFYKKEIFSYANTGITTEKVTTLDGSVNKRTGKVVLFP